MKASVFSVNAFSLVMPVLAHQLLLGDLPEIHIPFTLVAAYDPAGGHNAFPTSATLSPL